jgi:hypothetical protein
MATVRATYGTGPAGTGLFLPGLRRSQAEPQEVDVWFLLLFLPVVPLARWQVSLAEVGAAEAAEDPRAVDLEIHRRARVPLRAALRRILLGLGAALIACLPLGFGVWRVGSPWATPLLSRLLGAALGPGLVDKLGMAIELGVVLGGAAVPILLMGHLDERTPRVGWRAAFARRRGPDASL